MTNLTVLVVDDDPEIIELVTDVLETQVHALLTASDGASARALFENHTVDAAFLDFELPDTNGVELLGEIKQVNAATEVVIMTGNATLSTAIQALRGGAYDFLLKPFESLELLRSVLWRIEDKLSLRRQVESANVEISGLYQYYRAAQQLVGALTYESVRRAAVQGLSDLAGGGKAVFYEAGDEEPLRSVAVHPPDGEARTVPIRRSDLRAETDRAGLEVAGRLRDAFAEARGALPASIYRLTVGGRPRAVLALEEAGTADTVSDDVLALFMAQIEASLANATLYEKMQELSLRDPLTGLYNYRYFQERLTEEVARCQRHGSRLSLLFIDIDNFKILNDTHGHPVGDQVLIGVADLLRGTSRASDVVSHRTRITDVAARYGGEEFVLILPETDPKGARVKAERVRTSIESSPFPGRETQPGGAVTVSIGVASFPEDAADRVDLIRMADRALYSAKGAGKNRVITPEDPEFTQQA